MFDPHKPEAILTFEDRDLAALPSSEDDRHEYKSSATRDSELADKIARAASAFWNSGGGLVVAGVNGHGQPDGGVALNVGRQSRRDWIDQAVSRVAPGAHYVVQGIEDKGAGHSIAAGSAVFLIGFSESEIGPHMAPDNRYYIRAGAHTVPASHFIVEAIHARRGLRTPVLRHVVRPKPADAGVLQVGIVALSQVPAIDVCINPEPVPRWLQQSWESKVPLEVPVISEQFPFFLDVHLLTLGERQSPPFQIRVTFRDVANRNYEQVFQVDLDKQSGPNLGEKGTYDIVRQLMDIEREIGKVADAIKSKR